MEAWTLDVRRLEARETSLYDPPPDAFLLLFLLFSPSFFFVSFFFFGIGYIRIFNRIFPCMQIIRNIRFVAILEKADITANISGLLNKNHPNF